MIKCSGEDERLSEEDRRGVKCCKHGVVSDPACCVHYPEGMCVPSGGSCRTLSRTCSLHKRFAQSTGSSRFNRGPNAPDLEKLIVVSMRILTSHGPHSGS